MSNPNAPHNSEPVSTRLLWWVAARAQLDAARVLGEPGKPADYWEALRLGTAISREVLAARWPDVTDLLQASAVESWTQLGEILGMTGTEAHDGLLAWLDEQLDLFKHTSTHGLSPAEAHTLADLATQVPL